VLLGRPGCHVVQEHGADPLASVRRVHTDLLDVHTPVHDVGNHEANGIVVLVGSHPGAARAPVAGQRLGGKRRAVRDRRHTNIAERITGRQLDRLEPADVFGPRLPH